LGFLFLPLALLGKKEAIITVILEREQTKETEKLDEKMAMELATKEKQEKVKQVKSMAWSTLFLYVLIFMGILVGGAFVVTLLKPIESVMQYIFFVLFILSCILVANPRLARRYGKITLTRKVAVVIMLTAGYIFLAMLGTTK
jgi:heme A synthase